MVYKCPSITRVLHIECCSSYGKITSSDSADSKPRNNVKEASQKHDDDFFKSIKGFLIFGKLFGVLPFPGIFGNSWKDLSFR